MNDNIFIAIHYILMQEIDSDASDVFAEHIGAVVGDINTLNDRYSYSAQLQWMAIYWIQQMAIAIPGSGSSRVHNLLVCRTAEEFIQVFKAIVLPALQIYSNIPDARTVLLPISAYEHSRAS